MNDNELLNKLPKEGTPEFAALMEEGKIRMDAEEKLAGDLVDRLDEHLNEPLDSGELGHLVNLVQCDAIVAEIARKIVVTFDGM